MNFGHLTKLEIAESVGEVSLTTDMDIVDVVLGQNLKQTFRHGHND